MNDYKHSLTIIKDNEELYIVPSLIQKVFLIELYFSRGFIEIKETNMDPVSNKSENNNITDMISERMPVAYSFNVETPNQLVDIMTEQGITLN
ncbi:unnamed protein product [Adineta steineri]|uniref:Uncharacterized protein n=1 Tax=Adineta steineri TaxID=433720 RepID=A0A814NSJ1_9BILA|nr:unnamed protein product [Adineta steineri]